MYDIYNVFSKNFETINLYDFPFNSEQLLGANLSWDNFKFDFRGIYMNNTILIALFKYCNKGHWYNSYCSLKVVTYW